MSSSQTSKASGIEGSDEGQESAPVKRIEELAPAPPPLMSAPSGVEPADGEVTAGSAETERQTTSEMYECDCCGGEKRLCSFF
jgi:hypothetical protein